MKLNYLGLTFLSKLISFDILVSRGSLNGHCRTNTSPYKSEDNTSHNYVKARRCVAKQRLKSLYIITLPLSSFKIPRAGGLATAMD
jgi:hypothetical protein